ncbi:ABC-type multidrug transport system fused ATPase/permease subunit [Virgibacillus halotolerans]|uniref:phage tail tape measure protein n=1 Tax=Virgibacillus halotolerans TaxID=1071053 RepID=UPI00195FEFDD|nr:phage tail tape measure protein [Virgibacillus halotolerans]MBM7598081.1 ABC-type multidrug transport system fused ATPase/permease subunit [Virgibacillus halotolerans]
MNNGTDLGILISASLDAEKSIGKINSDLKRMESQLHNIGLTVDTKGLDQKIQAQMAGIKKTMNESLKMDMGGIEKNNSALFSSIKNLESQFGGSTQKVVKDVALVENKTGQLEQKIKSYMVTMKTADDQIKKIRLAPELDKDTGKEIISPKSIQTIEDSTKKLRERDQVLSQELKNHRELQSIERQRAEEENKKEVKSQNDRLSQELKNNKELLALERKRSEEQQKMGTKIGQSNNLKQLDTNSRQHLDTVLKQQDALKGLKIIQSNVNETSGKWSALISKNSSENLKLTGTIDRSTGAVHRQNQEIKQATASQMGMLQSLKVAAMRVPVWMGAMTAFYAPLRGMKSAIDNVRMLDERMVELRRVMDATPQTYNKLITESIDLSQELGNRVADVSQAMTDFSRQGYEPDMLMDLTKTATILSNISDLSPSDGMDTITAGLKAFDIEAKDSMSLIDRLNEVDNNYAISTADLSNAMMKSAATANTFGVSLDSLIGHTAAIGITTRESGNIIGKLIAA